MKTLVTCFRSPDMDGFACGYAYSELLIAQDKDAVFGMFGVIQEEVAFVLDFLHLKHPKPVASAKDFDAIILVDTSQVNGLDVTIDAKKVIEIIDHRSVHEADQFPNAKLQIDQVGSAATLVAERFVAGNKIPTKESAVLLYSAIVSNTLNYQAKVTTDRDNKMAEWLQKHVSVPPNYVHQMFRAKSDLSGKNLRERLADDAAWFSIAGKREGILQLEIIGTKHLVDTRKDEMLRELSHWQKELRLDISFISLVDLEQNMNIFVTADKFTINLLEQIFDIKFKDNIAHHQGLILRKEITPLIKHQLEKNY